MSRFFSCRNPALEEQACDRIYRVGQQKDVVIHRSAPVNGAVSHVLSCLALACETRPSFEACSLTWGWTQSQTVGLWVEHWEKVQVSSDYLMLNFLVLVVVVLNIKKQTNPTKTKQKHTNTGGRNSLTSYWLFPKQICLGAYSFIIKHCRMIGNLMAISTWDASWCFFKLVFQR